MLPRGEHPPATWLVPLLVAACWWGVLALAGEATVATQRSLVFLGGPLLLLAGLHARLVAFLHAPERLRLLPLPIDPDLHWRQALTRHRPELALSLALGIAAVLAAAISAGSGSLANRLVHGAALAIDFVWLGVFAALLEPFIVGVSAVLGRRFPEQSRGHELQRALGGGWTTPEAVVHLWAPAIGVGLATALAMPGQLGWERWIDGDPLALGHWLAALAPLPLAFFARVSAPRLYREGIWEAVPWLAEATRTLAGPPRPEETPAWLRWIGDPWARLLLVQFLRLTPVPMLRLAAVLGFVIWIALRDQPPGGPAVAAGLALIGLWLIPARVLVDERRSRARMAGALPLPAPMRFGGVGRVWMLLAAPAVLVVAALAVRGIASIAS